jgi:hypothetical protein
MLTNIILLGDSQGAQSSRDNVDSTTRNSIAHLIPARKTSPHLLAARLHSYSHASLKDLCKLLQCAKMLKKAHVTALKQVVAECEICVQVGRPTPSRKVSPIRVFAEFNLTVHIDFMFITIRDTSVIVLHIVDSATAFSVAVVVPSHDLIHAAN